MSYTSNIGVTYAIGSNNISISGTASDTDDMLYSIDSTLTSSQADKEFTMAIDVSEMKSWVMLSSTDCVVDTNDSATPDDTINLVGGVPLVWCDGWGYTNPLTTDVTKFFVTNSEAEAATFQFAAVVSE
jgi:hypothetical protein